MVRISESMHQKQSELLSLLLSPAMVSEKSHQSRRNSKIKIVTQSK